MVDPPTHLTESQLARHDRILDTAQRLAAIGGFDAVQMRLVASEADVALGTLYRYFPSKEYLLVAVMLRQVGELSQRLSVRPPQGDEPGDRLINVLERAVRAQQRHPELTTAMVRALVSGDTTVAPLVREVRSATRSILFGAVGDPSPSRRDEVAVDLLDEVWLSALVGWISGAASASSVTRKLTDAVEMMFGGDLDKERNG